MVLDGIALTAGYKKGAPGPILQISSLRYEIYFVGNTQILR